MKSTSFIKTLAIALAAVGINTAAQAATSPWDTLEGTINIKGLGNGASPAGNPWISYSDVKVSARLTDQAAGAKVTPPSLNNGQPNALYLAGMLNKAVKVTNKEILAATVGVVGPSGYKIRWAKTSAGSYLEAYNNKTGDVKSIPNDLLQVGVSWVAEGAGLYSGTATLTATPTTSSGTSVYVSSGKISGLTTVSGRVYNYLPFSGVGKYTADAKKGYSTSGVKISGIGQQPAAN